MAPPTGIQQKFFAKLETTYDAALAFAITDGIDLRELKLEPNLELKDIVGHTGSGSRQGVLKGRESHKWSAISHLMPVSAGVAPDIGPILKAAFGVETVSGGVSVTYSFDTMAAALSLQLMRYVGIELGEIANGAWVEQIDFEISDEPKITLSGGYASHGFAKGGATCNGAQSIAATTITLQAGDAKRFRAGAYIAFADGEDNSGAGYRITSVNNAADTMVITPGLVAGVADTVAIDAHALGQTITGNQIGGINTTVTVGGDSALIINGSASLKGDQRARNDELTVKNQGLFKSMREVSADLNLYLKTSNNVQVGKAWNIDAQAIVITIGDTAGQKLQLNFPACIATVPPIDVADDAQAKVALSFRADENSTGDDEMTAVWL